MEVRLFAYHETEDSRNQTEFVIYSTEYDVKEQKKLKRSAPIYVSKPWSKKSVWFVVDGLGNQKVYTIKGYINGDSCISDTKTALESLKYIERCYETNYTRNGCFGLLIQNNAETSNWESLFFDTGTDLVFGGSGQEFTSATGKFNTERIRAGDWFYLWNASVPSTRRLVTVKETPSTDTTISLNVQVAPPSATYSYRAVPCAFMTNFDYTVVAKTDDRDVPEDVFVTMKFMRAAHR